MIDDSERTEVALEFFQNIHGSDFPMVSLLELPSHTRMALGTLDILGLSTAGSWEGMIAIAVERAFDIGFEAASEPIEPLPEERIQAVKDLVLWAGGKLDLVNSLKSLVGETCCTWWAWDREHYHLVVMSCLSCGAHRRLYPDRGTLEGLVSIEYRNFCSRHSKCAT